MSRKLSLSYKLSPNEEAAVLRSQREERRKTRLVQVREQEKEAARKTREAERQKREREKQFLQENIQSHLQASHAAELAAVEQRYTTVSRHIGLGHRQAQQVQEEESRLHELRLLLAAKQRERARDRHIVALKEELSLQQQRKGEKRRHVERLRLTREQEGKRSRQNASQLATQPPIIMDLVAGKDRRVRLQEVEGYSSSYYHMPSCTVQRAASLEKVGPDAQQMAELMSAEMQTLNKQCSAAQEEQRELARLRYMHAINKVKMEKERQELMDQLKALEREDRTLRQKTVATIPCNMDQPVEQRKMEEKEQQRDMEQAFERLFVTTHGVSTHPTLLEIGHQSSPSPQPSISVSHEHTPRSQVTTDDSILERLTAIVGSATPDPMRKERVYVSIPTGQLSENDSRHTPELSVSDLSVSEVSPAPPSTHSEPLSLPFQSISTEQEPTSTQSESTSSTVVPRETVAASTQPDLGRMQGGKVLHTVSRVERLVSVVQAQQQAWTQRLAARKDPGDGFKPPPPAVSPSPSLHDLSSHSLSHSPEPLATESPERAAAVPAGPVSSSDVISHLPVSRPPAFPSPLPLMTPSSLPRPDLSLATENSDPRQPSLQETSDTAVSLDTTPTHTTLHLPMEDPPTAATTLEQRNTEPDVVTPLSPSSLQTVPSFSLPSTTSASLQEAFLRRKMNFVRESQRRLEQLKSNARERQVQSSLKSNSRHSSTAQQSPRSPSSRGEKENKKRVVTFSSPVLSSSHASGLSRSPQGGRAAVSVAVRGPQLSRGKEKIGVKEMRDRNQRIYNRLPEVRRKKLEEKRSPVYASNRQKAKVYQQQLRAKLQKKPLKLNNPLKKPPFK